MAKSVITIKVKLYQVTGYAWAICNPHFYKYTYLHMICKTMSTYIFRNKNEKGRDAVKNKVIKKNKLLMVFNIGKGKEYEQFIRTF